MHSPPIAADLLEATNAHGFEMTSDPLTGAFLRTLAASKRGAHLLEIGTGTGLASAWMLDGMDDESSLLTVDSDIAVTAIAHAHLGHDPRLTIRTADGGELLRELRGRRFDLLFADSWPGKFHDLDLALDLIAPGGFYVVDDMLPQPSWPDNHAPKVTALLHTLEALSGFAVTVLNWASGVVVAARQG